MSAVGIDNICRRIRNRAKSICYAGSAVYGNGCVFVLSVIEVAFRLVFVIKSDIKSFISCVVIIRICSNCNRDRSFVADAADRDVIIVDYIVIFGTKLLRYTSFIRGLYITNLTVIKRVMCAV